MTVTAYCSCANMRHAAIVRGFVPADVTWLTQPTTDTTDGVVWFGEPVYNRIEDAAIVPLSAWHPVFNYRHVARRDETPAGFVSRLRGFQRYELLAMPAALVRRLAATGGSAIVGTHPGLVAFLVSEGLLGDDVHAIPLGALPRWGCAVGAGSLSMDQVAARRLTYLTADFIAPDGVDHTSLTPEQALGADGRAFAYTARKIGRVVAVGSHYPKRRRA